MGVLIRFLLVGFVLYLLITGLKAFLLKVNAQAAPIDDLKKQTKNTSKDPFGILGISKTSDKEAIKKAYRTKLAEYHPDKVSHLGEEIQNLAHVKSQEISWAYEQLQR